jgi:5S rRNA maturation endonuclease (ribonuclease M5)
MKNIVQQEQLRILSINVMEKFEDIVDCLGITMSKQRKMWVGVCPIHGGDKYNAFNIYDNGDECTGFWRCRTHNCNKYFANNVIGFIRGVLSHQKYDWRKNGDKIVSFQETLDFISNCIKEDFSSINIDYDKIEKRKFINSINGYNKDRLLTSDTTRADIHKLLTIPSPYFINRGFKPEILTKYDVGTCNNPANLLYNSVVVPVYNDDHTQIIGTTSRSLYEKCPKCSSWHNPKQLCPNRDEIFKYSKWRHSLGFKKENYLYNYWFAKQHIYRTKVAIITESPGNVWALEQSGLPIGLASFGTSFSDTQLSLLNKTGALSVILLGDNDEAGQEYNGILSKRLHNMFNIHTIIPSKIDIGEMTTNEIKQQIFPTCIQCKEQWILP